MNRFLSFHVVSCFAISDDTLNRMHEVGFDFSRSPLHEGLSGTDHYHYLFCSDSLYSLESFRRFFSDADFITYCVGVSDPQAIYDYVLHF